MPDELLYSWLGRLAFLNALGSPRDCAERIFGVRSAIPGIDLPSRLQCIFEQLGDRSPFQSIDELLDNGTLLPYHRPFLSESRHRVVRQALIFGDGKGLKNLMGRVANRFGANPPLCFCAQCVSESIATHGCPYWARQHQLPGVSCCTRHRILLRYQPALSLRTDRQRFILPPWWSSAECHIEADERQLRFARLSQELLASQLPCLDPQQRAAAYRRAARELGFGKSRGRTDHTGLAEAVRVGFADFQGFEHRNRLLAPAVVPLGWIRDLIERPERAVHPICHLLLIDFLFGSVAAFAITCAEHEVNGAAAIDSTPPLEAPHTIAGAELETLLRDTTISCRRLAGFINRSVTTIVKLRRARGVAISERRKSLDELSLDRIVTGLALGNPPKEVAARCEVSLSTVYRVRSEHCIACPPPNPNILRQAMADRRRRWLCALSLNRGSGVNDVRAAAPADYAWLYRHDRAWLLSTTRPRHQRHHFGPRLDWRRRDAELCERVREHVSALHRLLPPQRVTKTRLIRPLGEALVRKNWERLPRLRALLDEVAESRESFAMRRIDHAITVVADSQGDLVLWRVKRQAGLRLWPSAMSAYASRQIARMREPQLPPALETS